MDLGTTAMSQQQSTFGRSAYGGEGWSPRTADTGAELGGVWGACGMDSEWRRLRAVLLHRPGAELEASNDPNAVQMLAPIDVVRAGEEHDAMAQAYRDHQVTVHTVEPVAEPRPNQMFCADLVFLTPQGAILARPASTVRAGEEREVARRLADLGVPILRSISGEGTFEGADAAWLDAKTVAVAHGLRTNPRGIAQIAEVLADMQVEVIAADLPYGTMHLMGLLRIVDADLAVAWPRRTPHVVVQACRERGMQVIFLPEVDDYQMNRSVNFVALGPRRILLEAGYTKVQEFYERHGIECVTVAASELVKAAGGFGCLTGVLQRDRA
jgi:N-dimethylarginine dimethylaminohydrolase